MKTAVVAHEHTINDARLAGIVERLMNRLEDGEAINLDDFLKQHADYESELRRVAPALFALAELGQPAREPLSTDGVLGDQQLESGRLGDFRIIRELGRGGMGVVYEAEQISLARRVALKVLPFAAVLEERQLKRFKLEATAVASLKHPNIVSVYCIGCERGVHFYAMEYVEGQTLAAVIEGMRGESREAREEAPGSAGGQRTKDDRCPGRKALLVLGTQRLPIFTPQTHDFIKSRIIFETPGDALPPGLIG